MNTTPEVLEIVEPVEKEITTLVQSTGLQPEVAQSLQQSFAPLFSEARDIITKSRTITVTDVSQVLQMKVARAYRLALRKVRTTGDATRRTLKEDSVKRGKAIDGFFNILVHLTDSEENRLAEAEQFALRKEEERKAALTIQRAEALKPFGVDVAFIDLGAMPDQSFTQLLENSRAAYEAKQEQLRKAEADRIRLENEKLKEEARIREENAKLKREAEEREAAAKAEREAWQAKRKIEQDAAWAAAEVIRKRVLAEAEAKLAEERQKAVERLRLAQEKATLEAQQAKEQAASEMRTKQATADEAARKAAELARKAKAEVEKQRKAREAAEAEAKALREAQEQAAREQRKRFEAEKAAAVAAQLAPDREKLTAYVAQVRALKVPNLNSGAGKVVADDLTARLEAFAAYCERRAATL